MTAAGSAGAGALAGGASAAAAADSSRFSSESELVELLELLLGAFKSANSVLNSSGVSFDSVAELLEVLEMPGETGGVIGDTTCAVALEVVRPPQAFLWAHRPCGENIRRHLGHCFVLA
jgi:hypothetical protein